jgi:hypothetical protein
VQIFVIIPIGREECTAPRLSIREFIIKSGAVGPTKRGNGTKIIALADDHSLLLAISIESASPHESQLVEGVLGHSFLDTLPARLIDDKAYDSDPLDRDLEMIAPSRGAAGPDAGRPSFAALPQAWASGTVAGFARSD